MTAYRKPMSKEEIIAEHRRLEYMNLEGQMTYSDMLRHKKELETKLMELAWKKTNEENS